MPNQLLLLLGSPSKCLFHFIHLLLLVQTSLLSRDDFRITFTARGSPDD